MLKKTITYTDYDGNERTEDFFFNLNKAEIMEMELGVSGGMTAILSDMIQKRDAAKIMATFKEFILKAYGEKTPDGKRFIKNKELSEAFEQTEAYSNLYVELLTQPQAAQDFMMGIVPADIASKAAEISKDGTIDLSAVSIPSDK